MRKKTNRTIIASLIAASLLVGCSSCGKKLEEKQLKQQESELIETLSLDSDMNFNNIYYAYASYGLGNYKLEFLSYKKPSVFDSSYEKDNPYFKTTYIISEEEYNEFYNLTGNTETLYPFNSDVISFFQNIIDSYEPQNTTRTLLTQNGEQIINELN